ARKRDRSGWSPPSARLRPRGRRAQLADQCPQALRSFGRDVVRGSFPETRVEDLQRDRALVARADQRRCRREQVELAIAGEAAVVPAPLDEVEREPWRRIGELEEADPV